MFRHLLYIGSAFGERNWATGQTVQGASSPLEKLICFSDECNMVETIGQIQLREGVGTDDERELPRCLFVIDHFVSLGAVQVQSQTMVHTSTVRSIKIISPSKLMVPQYFMGSQHVAERALQYSKAKIVQGFHIQHPEQHQVDGP
jgi:hypothetical protein